MLAKALPARHRAAWTLALVAVAAAVALPVQAALYKWVDANGRVVYSDQPPPGNVKAETLNTPVSPGNPNVMKDLVNRDLEYRKQQAERAETQQKARDDRVELNKKNEACTQAKAQITQLGWSQYLIYRTNEKGEQVVMDDAARAREKERLQAWIRDNNCPS